MKIDRLLGIIILLHKKEKITAPELAKRFEVSKRTILRDIEDICKAGIPIVTYQGGGGGISVAEGYKLDKSVLSIDELRSIITGLKGLSSVSETAIIEGLITKLSPNNQKFPIKDNIKIDLASHYKSSLAEKISIFENAIYNKRLVSFDYYSNKGNHKRILEPYCITFKWSSWYIYGFCKEKNDFRLFKLNRLWKLSILEEVFESRALHYGEPDFSSYFDNTNKITLLFDKSIEYLIVEEYGPDSYDITENGEFRLVLDYINRDYIIRWILGLGEKVKVLEPEDIIQEILNTTKKMSDNYK